MQKAIGRRYTWATFMMPIAIWLSLSGCATKLPPSVQDDGRGCLVMVLTESSASGLPQARAGDLLMQQACVERLINTVVSCTHSMIEP